MKVIGGKHRGAPARLHNASLHQVILYGICLYIWGECLVIDQEWFVLDGRVGDEFVAGDEVAGDVDGVGAGRWEGHFVDWCC
jgi:hypothetical protein